MEDGETAGFAGTLAAIGGGIWWFIQSLVLSVYDILYAITHPSLWLDWVFWTGSPEDKESLALFIYYGGSTEFFFAVFMLVLVATGIGFWRRDFMWAAVRCLEGVANVCGRTFAWAGILMVIQQIIVVFMQRIFTRPDISFGFGIPLQFDISWFAEELKLYNAMIICMCVSYTFVQGGHVRVDLIYSAVKFRTKKIIDMFLSLIHI